MAVPLFWLAWALIGLHIYKFAFFLLLGVRGGVLYTVAMVSVAAPVAPGAMLVVAYCPCSARRACPSKSPMPLALQLLMLRTSLLRNKNRLIAAAASSRRVFSMSDIALLLAL